MVNEENDCHSHIFEPLFSKTIMLKTTVDIFTDRSKGALLLWILYFISFLFCYAFMHVCLLMPCGHLLGKG